MAVSRRGFIKQAAAAAGVAAVGAMLPAGVQAAMEPKKWDMETDVLVIGFGGAGAFAAMAAADAGSNVIMVEKQAEATHYPNTRMSGGIFHSPDPDGDREAIKKYAKAMFSGDGLPWKKEHEMNDKYVEEFAEAWAEYTPKLYPMVKSWDPAFKGLVGVSKGAAFPDFPGAKEAKYQTYRSSLADRIDAFAPGYLQPKEKKGNGEALFYLINEQVKKRKDKIKICFETPAKDLIMSENGEVIGAVVENAGKKLNIKAKKAVVLTSGGYEYNYGMRKAFLEGPGVDGWAFYGTTANEGDGIEMAMKAGAALEKVGKAASRIITAVPIRHNGLKLGLITPCVGKGGSIVVDNSGKRYANEVLVTKDPSRYFFYKEAVKFDIMKLAYPRSPSWLIFDDKFINSTTITDMAISTVGYGYVPWTKDNSDAVKRGWILKGDSLESLAKAIQKHEDNMSMLDAENLKSAVEDFNKGCETKKDSFGRDPKTLVPVAQGPFYALPLYAGGPNTKGGILADGSRRVVNWKGEPIPRLFTAGEISSVLKFVYQGGGNITECMVFGPIAGKNAAAMKPWS